MAFTFLVALKEMIKTVFRLSFHLNTGLFGQLKMSKADLQKRAGESFLRHSVPGTEFATSVLIKSCIFIFFGTFPNSVVKIRGHD